MSQPTWQNTRNKFLLFKYTVCILVNKWCCNQEEHLGKETFQKFTPQTIKFFLDRTNIHKPTEITEILTGEKRLTDIKQDRNNSCLTMLKKEKVLSALSNRETFIFYQLGLYQSRKMTDDHKCHCSENSCISSVPQKISTLGKALWKENNF